MSNASKQAAPSLRALPPKRNAISALLDRGPATAEDLAEQLGDSASLVRNELAVLFHQDKLVGCDQLGRYFLLSDFALPRQVAGELVLGCDSQGRTYWVPEGSR